MADDQAGGHHGDHHPARHVAALVALPAARAARGRSSSSRAMMCSMVSSFFRGSGSGQAEADHAGPEREEDGHRAARGTRPAPSSRPPCGRRSRSARGARPRGRRRPGRAARRPAGCRARPRPRCPGRSGRPTAGRCVGGQRVEGACRPARRCGWRRAPARARRRARRRCVVRRGRAPATGLSPAATARASSSAMVGNSARIRRSRVRTWLVRWLSRASTPADERDRADEQPELSAEPGRVSIRSSAVRRGDREARPAPTAPARCGTRGRSCRCPARSSRRRTEVGAAEHPLDACRRPSAAAARRPRPRPRSGTPTRRASVGRAPSCGRSRR